MEIVWFMRYCACPCDATRKRDAPADRLPADSNKSQLYSNSEKKEQSFDARNKTRQIWPIVFG
jgi:hypothetical protein